MSEAVRRKRGSDMTVPVPVPKDSVRNDHDRRQKMVTLGKSKPKSDEGKNKVTSGSTTGATADNSSSTPAANEAEKAVDKVKSSALHMYYWS